MLTMPLHDQLMERARRECANHPRHLVALDCIDQAWKDSLADNVPYGVVNLTWRQINYLEAQGFNTTHYGPMTIPIERPDIERSREHGWDRDT